MKNDSCQCDEGWEGYKCHKKGSLNKKTAERHTGLLDLQHFQINI